MNAKKIAFFDARPYDIRCFDEANSRFGFFLQYIQHHLTEQTAQLAQGCDVVCAFVHDELSAPVLSLLCAHNLRLIALRCAGYNNVDLQAAFKKIHVVRVPDYSPYAVAEHAVALILALNRKTHRSYYRTRDGNFSIDGLMGFDLHGKTAGVVGTGKIGRALIAILKGFGMEVLAFDARPEAAAAGRLGFAYADLDTLYASSDIISLNCPLTRDTYHCINSDSIAKMKRGVFLINTGRGRLVDTRALIDGLKTKHIGAAGLDVYEEESDIFYEDFSNTFIDDDVLARLLTFSNVLITSHQGFFTHEALNAIALTTLANIRDFFAGEQLPNEICYQCASSSGACRKKTEGRCF